MSADRRAAAEEFLAAAGWSGARRAPLAGDASNRRYERVTRGDGQAAVLMDAPPDRGEDVRPFAALTGYLRGEGFAAPELLAADAAQGFLLLEDLGDALFARVAAETPPREPALYEAAVDALARLARAAPPEVAEWAPAAGAEPIRHALRPYGLTELKREARLALSWWRPAARGGEGPPESAAERAEAAAAFDDALAAALADASAETGPDGAGGGLCLTLRDYHAENLIWRAPPADAAAADPVASVGLLDYQDALIGRPAYDLASLLEDARRDVNPALAEAMIARFIAAAGVADAAAFRAGYAALAAQRNLKIIGIFARLWLRDGKARYLSLIPRVWAHLQRDLEHPALADLRAVVGRLMPPPDPSRLAAIAALPPGALGPAGLGGDAWDARPPASGAVVLAAGLGTRMRPLTDTTPKPLLAAHGRSLLDRALDQAKAVGVRQAAVNLHYLGAQIRAFATSRSAAEAGERRPLELVLSDETDALLETGGGVKAAAPLLSGPAILTLNSDAIWLNARALAPLALGWRPAVMDALLLLTPKERALGYTRPGDFRLSPEGRLIRRGAAPAAPFVFTGAQILSRRAAALGPDGPFSLNIVWDQLIAEGRAFGVVDDAGWIDVGTPAGLAAADAALAEQERG